MHHGVSSTLHKAHFYFQWRGKLNKALGVFLVGMSAAFAACAATPTNPPNTALAVSARSVVGLAALDASGHALVQNSAVVIAKGLVIGSCHVLTAPHTSAFVLEYQHQTYPATLHKLDLPDDVCSFAAPILPAPPLRFSSTPDVKTGQPVYVIGADASGLASVVAGNLAVLPTDANDPVQLANVQVPASDVGGGLFDAKGDLVGVAYGAGKRMAFPVSEIWNLAATGTPPVQPGGHRLAVSSQFLAAVDATNRGDFVAALGPMQALAAQGDRYAQYFLSGMYLDSDQGVSKSVKKAVSLLEQSSKQGDVNAQFTLGMAEMTGAYGVAKDPSAGLGLLHAVAQRHVADAQAALGMLYLDGQGVTADPSKAVTLLRQAANHGSSMGLFGLGAAYATGTGVPKDKVQAVKWLTLAKSRGDKHAGSLLSKLEFFMSSSKIAKADKLAKQWLTQWHG